jgi:hypothetical protein
MPRETGPELVPLPAPLVLGLWVGRSGSRPLHSYHSTAVLPRFSCTDCDGFKHRRSAHQNRAVEDSHLPLLLLTGRLTLTLRILAVAGLLRVGHVF